MQPFKRLLGVVTRPWFIGLYLVFLAALFLYVDKPVAEYFHSLDLRHNFSFLNHLTKLGLSAVYMAAFLAGALFFRYLYPNAILEARFWFLWFCVMGSGIICVILKILIGRARPSMWFEVQYYGFYGLQSKAPFWSFPSGHTTTVMALACGLSILFPRHWLICLFFGFLVALSRVLLVHHYLSDIFAASYFVVVEIGILLWVLEKRSWLLPAWKGANAQKMLAYDS